MLFIFIFEIIVFGDSLSRSFATRTASSFRKEGLVSMDLKG